jgi:hypothetical protein
MKLSLGDDRTPLGKGATSHHDPMPHACARSVATMMGISDHRGPLRITGTPAASLTTREASSDTGTGGLG